MFSCFNKLFPFYECYSLEELFLSHNQIYGSIPPHLSYSYNLTTIDLSHNLFSGKIPPTLGNLWFLQHLDLSFNNLTGNIPSTIGSLYEMNLSYNSLEGPIPDSFRTYYSNNTLEAVLGNTNLCSDHILGLRNCSTRIKKFSSKTNTIILFTVILGFLLLGIIGIRIAFLSRRKEIRNKQHESKALRTGNLFSTWNYDGNIAFEDIITATEHFDIKYCIGTGGYGSVYKANLPSGKVVALKKLHSLEADEPSFDKSFRNEAKVLSEIHHRNIVKLFMGFVYIKDACF